MREVSQSQLKCWIGNKILECNDKVDSLCFPLREGSELETDLAMYCSLYKAITKENVMETIESFKVNHKKLLPGVYVSRRDKIGNCFITTFDIRLTAPNREPVINTAELHTIEHLGATMLRNEEYIKDKVIYFGPMGCRTGLYLVLGSTVGYYSVVDIYNEIRSMFVFKSVS